MRTSRDQQLMFETPPSGPTGVERRFGLAGVLGVLGVEATPVRCGKFELDRKLGEGAMGVVYVATDIELRRDVALKLLRTTGSAKGYKGLRREARALARLNHPNVVQVLAVGESEGQTWIAMELIEGGTLADWSEREPPAGPQRFRAALQLLIAAGRGLAAAHGAGLVHRDFKPANVLVGPGGEAKVADFGLARADEQDDRTPRMVVHEALQIAPVADTLSRTGTVVGTPLYMSPELHVGGRADAASDQFAFAVSAWQVLHGMLPFAGKTRQALVDALESGELCPLPRGTYTVRSVSAALRRAMAPDPAARYPSMEALLDALAARSSRRWWAVGALGLAALGLASVLGDDPERGCSDAAATREIEEIWGEARREQLRAALLKSGPAYAATTWDTVERAVDGFGQRWVAENVGACEAGQGDDAGVQRQQDARQWCLRGQLQEVDAFLQRLGNTDPKALERAVAVADQLPRPSMCRRPGEIGSGHGSPLARELQAELALAAASSAAGEYAEAGRMARGVMDQAREAGLHTVEGDASYRAGSALLEIDDPDALSMIEASYETALSYGQWPAAAERARRLVEAYERAHQIDEAWTWLRHANAALQRAPDPVLEARILRAECALLEEEDKYDEALPVCERALARIEGEESADHVRTQVVSLIASLQGDLGDYDASIEMFQWLLDDARRRRGPTHPRVGGMMLNLGGVAENAGDYALAETSFRGAAEVFAVAYGPTHGWVASAYLNLSGLYVELEKLEQAEQAARDGLEVMGDRQDARTARLLHNLASVRRKQGRDAEALELLLRVSAIETKVLPLDHPQTAYTHHTLGMVYMNLQRLEDAQRELDRALQMRSQGADPLLQGKLRATMADLADRRGQPGLSLEHAEEAAKLFTAVDTPPAELGVVLARAAALLAEAGDAEAARDRIAQAEAVGVEDSKMTDALLARARSALEAAAPG